MIKLTNIIFTLLLHNLFAPIVLSFNAKTHAEFGKQFDKKFDNCLYDTRKNYEDFLDSKFSILKNIEDRIKLSPSLYLLEEAAKILTTLFFTISNDNTEDDRKLIEELKKRVEKLKDIKPSDASIDKYMSLLQDEFNPGISKLITDHQNNTLLCGARVYYFDLNVTPLIGGGLNSFKQSCISLFGSRYIVRGANIVGSLGVQANLSIGFEDVEFYYIPLTYKIQKGAQAKSCTNAGGSFYFLATMKGSAGAANILVGPTLLLGANVDIEYGPTWLREKESSRSIKRKKLIWHSIYSYVHGLSLDEYRRYL